MAKGTSSDARKANRARSFARGLVRKAEHVKAQDEREKANKASDEPKPWEVAKYIRATKRLHDPEISKRRDAHEKQAAKVAAIQAKKEQGAA